MTEWEKIPFIPNIYFNNKCISEIKAKCELFNSFFSGQCMLFVNDSDLLIRFTTYTESVLVSLEFSVEQVSNINKKLDLDKAHGHDKIIY